MLFSKMLQTWEMIIFVIWGIPSVALYIFVMYQLLFKPDFKAAFFKLATVIGFVDLSNYIIMWFCYKLISHPVTSPLYFLWNDCIPRQYCIPKNNFFFIFLNWSFYYLSRVRELLLVSTAFNRLTAICFPYNQQIIWDKCLWIFIGVALICPFLLTLDLLFGFADIIPFLADGSDDTYVIGLKPAPLWNISKLLLGDKSLLHALHTTITSIISLSFNIISLVTLYFRTKKSKHKSKLPKKGEINLLILSCFDFILDCLSEVHQVYMYTFVINKDLFNPTFDRLCLLYPWIYDIINLSRPYLLIIMCQKMQDAFLTALKINPKKLKPSNGTVSSIKVY